MQTLFLLESAEDINSVTDYFSYEHFYVIYCKFWELDTDHDLWISKEDLSRHAQGGQLSTNFEHDNVFKKDSLVMLL